MINFVLGVIPLIAVGVIYWIICRITNASVSANIFLFIILIAVLGADWYHFYDLDGSTPSVIGWGVVAVIVYIVFKMRRSPEAIKAIEAMKPKLYMRDDKVVLFIPKVKSNDEPSTKNSRSHAQYGCEYVFDEASVTGDNGMITVAGSGIKTTLEPSDSTEPGTPINKENFKSRSFQYHIDDMRIADDVLIEVHR